MERLLTPLVTRLLERFVKRSQEGDAGKFKVSLSGAGGFSLHNLELDLGSVLPAELLESRRAFARSLQIKVPWTALNTQSIEVIFDTVEIVLGDPTQQEPSKYQNEQTQDNQSDIIAVGSTSSNTTTTSGGGWLGLGSSSSWLTSNLQSLALRAGLNISFTIKNLVVKYVYKNDFAVTVALEQLIIANRDSTEWRDLVETPEEWLMKNCLIKGLSICIDQTGSLSSLQTYLPLLRLSSLSIAALLPIFAYLEGGDLAGDDAKVAVEVDVGNVQGAVNDQQIEWIYSLLEKLRKSASTSGRREREDESVVAVLPTEGEAGAEMAEKEVDEKEEYYYSEEHQGGQLKALGIFSRIWDVAVDEAAYIRNLETLEVQQQEQRGRRDSNGVVNQMAIHDLNQLSDNDINKSAYPGPPTQAELTLTLNSLRLQLGVANISQNSDSTNSTIISPHPRVIGPSVVPILEIEIGLTRVCSASISTTMLDVEMQVQNISVQHNSTASSGEAIVHLLSITNNITTSGVVLAEEEPVWDEIFGIHPCQVPLRSAGRLRSPENALEFRKNVLDDGLGVVDNSIDESVCSIHVGYIWIAMDPLLRHHIELFMERLARASTATTTAAPPPPSALALPSAGEIKEDQKSSSSSSSPPVPSIWSSVSGWDVEIDALQIALRCSMKNVYTATTADTTTADSSSTTSAALLIQATEAISYHTNHTANVFRPQGFQCPLIFSVVHGSWHPMPERSSQSTTAAIPGAVRISKAFTLSGSLRQDASIQGPFFSISPLELDGSGEEIAAALSCILAAVTGTGTEPRDPLPLLSGWAGRAQLSLQQGLRINKDLNNGGADGGFREEKAWEVVAESLKLVLTSKSSAAVAPPAASAVSATENGKGEVCASLDLTTLRCCASPGLLISVDLVCLGIETHCKRKAKEEEVGADEKKQGHSPPPAPLAILTNLNVRSEDNLREYTFGTLNIMSDPITTRAAIVLAAGLRNNTSSNPPPAAKQPVPAAAVASQTEQSKVSSSEEAISIKYGFNMVAFTVFPAKTEELQAPSPASSSKILRGVTGWLSSFSLEMSPLSRRVSLNCLELSQCRLDGSEDEIIELPMTKALCFERKLGTPVLQASSTVISSPSRQSQEQFTVELAPLKTRLTPELLSTFTAFLPPNPTETTIITEVLVLDSGRNSSSSVPLLHGNVTFGSFSLELAQEDKWLLQGQPNVTSNPQKSSLTISFDEAFVLINQESASVRRPWLFGTLASALAACASVLGLGARVEKHAGGAGSNCTQILLPTDINALMHQWTPTRSLIVALEAHTLDFRVSQNVAEAVALLKNAYSNNESAQPAEAEFVDNKVIIDVLSDDLRSGAFILAGDDVTMAGLQPLRAGVRSLGGRGKESLQWRYAYPRSIGCIFIQGVEPSDFPAPLSLSRRVDTTGEFINVALWPKIIRGTHFAGTCFFIAEGAQHAAAHFWRLCWTSPADFSDAKSLLNRIFINPQGQELWNIAVEDAPGRQKSPLVAPLSFGFSFKHIEVSLLGALTSTDAAKTSSIQSVHVLNIMAVLKLEKILVSMHKWNTNIHQEALAIDAAMTACIEYTEATTLRTATLIEPFDVMLSFEDVSDVSPEVEETPQDDAGLVRSSDSSPLSVLRGSPTAAGGLAGVLEDTMVFAARREPAALGSYVKFDFTTPVVVNITELAVYDLQRLVALTTTIPANDHCDGSRGRPFASPIKITNWTDHIIGFQQFGTPASATLLAPGESTGFHWAATPRSRQGAQLVLQFALIAGGNDGNLASLPSWSNVIDVMTIGGASLIVPGSEYTSATVAVMVERDEAESIWHVHLRHGLRIYNQQDVSLKALVMNPSGPQIMEIEARESEDIPLLSAGVGGAGSPVRLWLGNRWSKEFYSRHEKGEVRVLEADMSFQLEVVGPDSIMSAAPLVAQFAGNDACTGHVVVAIWPPLKLSNELPHSITLDIPQRLAEKGQSFSLGPSETLAIPVDITGGEIVQLASGIANDLSAPSVSVFCPPLKSTENDSPLLKAISGVAPSDNAIYILSPGNAAQFLLPWQSLPKSLPCFLLTDANDISPGLSLRLIPQWKLVNKLAIPVDLELSQSRTISIPSNAAIVDDLRASSVRQMTLSIMYEESKYTSKEFLFDLENPIDQQVSLLPSPIDKNMVISAHVRVGLELKLTTVGEYKAFELVVSPSYYLENSSSLPLSIREPLTFGTALKKQELLLRPQCSLPLLVVPAYLEVALPENAQDRKPTWYAFPLDEARQDGCIFLDGASERFTLSYGIISEPTHQRLIFFRDPDPPVYLINNFIRSLDLSWTSGDDQLATVLPPGQKLQFTVDTELPAVDAWDESVLVTDLRARHNSFGTSILIKAHGEEEWHEVLLEEGEQQGSLFNVRKQRKGAGIALIVEQKSLKQVIKTLNASIQVEQFCVLLQDDERGRITGTNDARPILAVAFNKLDLNVTKASGPPSEAFVSKLRCEELRCSTCFPAQQLLLWSADSIFAASVEMVITTVDGERSVSISDASLDLPSFFLHIDDTSFELYVQYKTLLEKPIGFQEMIAPPADAIPQDEAKINLCAKRVHINSLQIGQLNASADIHLTPARTGLPVAVDTDRSPLSISKMSVRSISVPVHMLLQGLAKHVVAEALLNAPLVIGSLQLFFNPTGLVQSIKRGVANMIELPLQGLQQGPLQFIAGLGQGSVSLVREISGWSLSSVVGFSRAASNALVGTFARSSIGGISQTPSSELEVLPETKASLVYGFAYLAAHLRCNLYDPTIGEILLFSVASESVIYQRDQAGFKISEPVVVIATSAIILYSDNGRTPSFIAWLNEASIITIEASLQISSSQAAPITDVGSSCPATIVTKFHRSMWGRIAPTIRRLSQK